MTNFLGFARDTLYIYVGGLFNVSHDDYMGPTAFNFHSEGSHVFEFSSSEKLNPLGNSVK